MQQHNFHIPVMGIGFTIDTPLKVSRYGIDSVIPIGDDILLERMRKMYCLKYELPYEEIPNKTEDWRAKRIAAYLTLINKLSEQKFEELKKSKIEIIKYFDLLPDSSKVKQEFRKRTSENYTLNDMSSWLDETLQMGDINVNIMTKLDKDNYVKGEKLPVEFNDAHAAVRGYVKSDLKGSIVLSAGLNPRLFGYMEHFEEFRPNVIGLFKKRIILKVSDYRSALIQGKFLAKKGLWVSEYRIESGLNCGGHAFATEGYLMGPILAEFRDKRNELQQTLQEVLFQSLEANNHTVPVIDLHFRVTAQGGVGTQEEHAFLLDHYQLNSIGWGTPFLLVPEVVNIDEPTLEKLAEAKEKDLYLSHISPLGVPFNNLRGNSKDLSKMRDIKKGRPGSSCPKTFLAFNTEFTDTPICVASRQYQHLKLTELDNALLSADEYKAEYGEITDKACICTGLGSVALLVNDLDTRVEGAGVSVCPGPNMAYFSKTLLLNEMVDHIYGRTNVITRRDRPNFFIKELSIYMDFLKSKLEEAELPWNRKQQKYFANYTANMKAGISYYKILFSEMAVEFSDSRLEIENQLETMEKALYVLCEKIEVISA